MAGTLGPYPLITLSARILRSLGSPVHRGAREVPESADQWLADAGPSTWMHRGMRQRAPAPSVDKRPPLARASRWPATSAAPVPCGFGADSRKQKQPPLPFSKRETNDARPPGATEPSKMKTTITLFLTTAVLSVALFGRMMSLPLSHDEQLFVSAAVMVEHFTIYKDFIYNHLPNFPFLLGAIYRITDTTHYLLAARLTAFGAWLVSLALLYLISMRWTQSRPVAFASTLLLLTNTLFLDAAGAYGTNSVIPVPFALLGIFLVLEALARPKTSAVFSFFGGVSLSIAIGMKANFVFIVLPPIVALSLVPTSLPFRQRLLGGLLPFALGGLLGGAPTLIAAASNWDAFWYSAYQVNADQHVKYMTAQHPDNPRLRLPGKLVFATSIWSTGGSLLLLAAVIGGIATKVTYGGTRGFMQTLRQPKVALIGSLCVLGGLISFLPTPSFDQYFMPPVPFFILLVVAMYATSRGDERRTHSVLLSTVIVLGLYVNSPTYRTGLMAVFDPPAWTALKVHATAQEVRGLVCGTERAEGRCDAFVATLAPIFVLEGSLQQYPELAAGPFVYRSADHSASRKLSQFKLTSVSNVGNFLAARMPDAVLVGFEGELDEQFTKFARENGYVEETRIFKTLYESHPYTVYLKPS